MKTMTWQLRNFVTVAQIIEQSVYDVNFGQKKQNGESCELRQQTIWQIQKNEKQRHTSHKLLACNL